MAIEADPITAAIITVAGHHGQSSGLLVAKPSSTAPGATWKGRSSRAIGVIVRDVIYRQLAGRDRAGAFGLKVRSVLAIIDRLEGGPKRSPAAT
jgi:hypothetical protein